MFTCLITPQSQIHQRTKGSHSLYRICHCWRPSLSWTSPFPCHSLTYVMHNIPSFLSVSDSSLAPPFLTRFLQSAIGTPRVMPSALLISSWPSTARCLLSPWPFHAQRLKLVHCTHRSMMSNTASTLWWTGNTIWFLWVVLATILLSEQVMGNELVVFPV